MASTKVAPAREIYQIKVTLQGSKPPVWRRLLVPAALTLAQLHAVLQNAMGWQCCHLHEFRIGGKTFGEPSPDVSDLANEARFRLSAVLRKVGAKATYTYDFGDGWEHSIVVEKILPATPGQSYPICVAGKRHCPPEDCGGVWGYQELLAALRDPTHEQHSDMLEWLGGEFDPEEFSIDEVNSQLTG